MSEKCSDYDKCQLKYIDWLHSEELAQLEADDNLGHFDMFLAGWDARTEGVSKLRVRLAVANAQLAFALPMLNRMQGENAVLRETLEIAESQLVRDIGSAAFNDCAKEVFELRAENAMQQSTIKGLFAMIARADEERAMLRRAVARLCRDAFAAGTYRLVIAGRHETAYESWEDIRDDLLEEASDDL